MEQEKMTDTFIEHWKPPGKNIAQSLLILAAINSLSAVILNAIGFGTGFITTLIFCQCIGISIYLCHLAAITLFRPPARASLQIAIIVAAVAIGAAIGTIFGALANGINAYQFIRQYSTVFAHFILVGLLFGVIAGYIFISLGKIGEEKMKRLETEKNALESELKLVQSQMEPHFLFNTLSNILGFIDRHPEKAKRMVESFTSFLRSSLFLARSDSIMLSQEMDVVRHYLEISSIRMGERLGYDFDVPDELLGLRIPPLLIQPLVENAVKHGLEPALKGGTVTVEARRGGDIVRIAVTDSGVGIKENDHVHGIALENIRKRLDLLYAERGKLIIRENEPSGIRAVIEVPYETGTRNHR